MVFVYGRTPHFLVRGSSMAVISLTDALQVTTIDAPTSEPASIDQLGELGFPADNPDFRAVYDRLMEPLKRRGRYVTPTFRVLRGVDDSSDVERIGGGRVLSRNRCGGLVHAPDAVYLAVGNWVVPAVARLEDPDPDFYACASWVGIDGTAFSAGPAIRVGVLSFIQNFPTAYLSGSNFFFHWPPAEFTTGGIPVLPGHWVTVLLSVSPGGHNAATSLINRTTGDQTQFSFSNAGGPGAEGKTAEWFVSKQQFGTFNTILGDFGQVFFDDCTALDRSAGVLQGGTGNNWDMVTSYIGGTVIAEGDLVTPTVIRCRHVGNPP
jgi:hypothetical protein